MTIPATMHLRHAPKVTGSARGRKAIATRLSRENWTEMARPAFSSPNHTGNLDRWRKKARERNSQLSDEQVDRLADLMRREFYADLGRRSGAARAAKAGAGRKVAAMAQAAATEPAA